MKALLITFVSGIAFFIGHFLSESMGHGKKIITLYLRQNYQYMVVIFMWIISAYFESKG